MRSRILIAGFAAALSAGAPAAHAQAGPTFEVRERVLKSLVYVRADNCRDKSQRAGTGFAFARAGHLVTAHHVVGGCSRITVVYEGAAPGQSRSFAARVTRVLARGDLALLSVDGAPAVPVLPPASTRADRNGVFAGLGYQNGQPTAGDQAVTFSTGRDLLREFLPAEARKELSDNGSAIDLDARVLRFNAALQPGMSGGPIVDASGGVIGVVAGGLKAGAAPASWGWPSEWLGSLMASTEPSDQSVTVAQVYYSLPDMRAEQAAIATGRSISCGGLTLTFRGARSFAEVARGADDQARLQHIVQMSTRPIDEINQLKFDVWADALSGATAVVPAGYPIRNEGQACVARAANGIFLQVVWGAPAQDAMAIQQVSNQFEIYVMLPLIPFQYGFTPDAVLSTAGPQFRDNGMVFNRKGFTQPKGPSIPGAPPPPSAHSFETLIAKSGSFLGVGTVNYDLPPQLSYCLTNAFQAYGCAPYLAYLREWTHFILATQLSTYPTT